MVKFKRFKRKFTPKKKVKKINHLRRTKRSNKRVAAVVKKTINKIAESKMLEFVNENGMGARANARDFGLLLRLSDRFQNNIYTIP